MSQRQTLIEQKAAEAGHEASPQGVVDLLNNLLPECSSESELARRLGLSSPSYLFYYCRRKGIEIVCPMPRVAALKSAPVEASEGKSQRCALGIATGPHHYRTEVNTIKTNGRPEPGQPRVIPAEARVLLRGLRHGIRTKRGRQELWYRLQGVNALRRDDEFRWLVDWDRMMQGDDSGWQPTVVSELGRLKNPEMIRGVARLLCKRRPNTQTAVTLIRRVVMMAENSDDAAKNPGDASALAKVIGTTIARYRRAHPALSFDQIGEALTMQSEILAVLQERAVEGGTAVEPESRNSQEG